MAKGPGSWKFDALQTTKDKDDLEEVFDFPQNFYESKWRKFHQAALEHWQYVLFELLKENHIVK